MDRAAGQAPDTVYSGVFPIAPTTFDEAGALDLDSQKRAIDFMIDARVNGICILANYSEQFSLTDAEREALTREIIEHVAGRTPVIVTTSHFSTREAAARSRRAQELGAAMVMLMPPYHGATIRGDETSIFEFYQRIADAVTIPIMVQDAPVSGTTLPAAFLAKLASEIELLRYFKIESPFAASKLRELIRLAGAHVPGPFDGEESITLIPDLEAGATGTMPSATIPEILRRVMDLWAEGQQEAAIALYEPYLPLINYENRQCGLRACKTLMREGGIIASEATRHPIMPLPPATRAGLLRLAQRLDPLILRWA